MTSDNGVVYNDDELVSPDWMNQDFFEMVLRKSEEDNLLKISDFKITPASKKGDHYASVIYRIKINYILSKTNSEEMKSIILKTEPYVEGVKKDMLGEKDVFDVEIRMYSETLPEIQKLLVSIGDKRKLTAKLLYHSISPVKIMIFEDISPFGFETVSNFGVGDVLSKLAFQRLAQFHAASMVLHQKKSNNVSSYTTSMYDMNFGGEGFFFFCEFLQSLIDEAENWPGFEIYVEKLKGIKQSANINGRKMCTPNTPGDGYNVLTHGDFHSKNMMFKNMDSKDAEIIMLDFQICFFATPAIDILYGLHMMTNSESKDELIEYYYEIFSSTLEKLEYSGKIPTFKDLQNELHKNRFYEVLVSTFAVPFSTVDMTTVNFDDMFDFKGKAADVRKELYQNLKVQEKFKKLLPDFLKRGVFD